MIVVIADDEHHFRKTVIQWIAREYELDQGTQDAAIEQIGSDESETDYLVLPINEDLRFLIAARLETLWERVQEHCAEEDRILVLLDLSWGQHDALDELVQLRANNSMRHFPVIIYSKSDSESDIRRCYEATANAYMIKRGSPQARRTHFFRTIGHWSRDDGDYRPPFASYAA